MLLILAAIPCYPVEQDEPGVHLVLMLVEAPAVTIVSYFNGDWLLAAGIGGEEVSQQARLQAPPRCGQLQLGQQLVPARIITQIERDCCLQEKTAALTACSSHLNLVRRKALEGPRLRNVLHPERGKPVICTHEEIVAGDPSLMIERRPVRLHPDGQRLPLILGVLIQGLPGSQCPPMHTQ